MADSIKTTNMRLRRSAGTAPVESADSTHRRDSNSECVIPLHSTPDEDDDDDDEVDETPLHIASYNALIASFRFAASAR
ncbi:uncharacterized protein MONOS_15039 [Monocercomonoides exilis]|uniref:uncharacterized protein n=1 Tax=Monocercomonoides exilis TaxID=2049356 RepID=UPI00355AB117|nr:hypothetical protein MONOS_15039 [Monocercomonoides exilis]|eukprot:MONOS_15039.1-p1 / transcript=MONOS_15039.1 / gene=MONOS_15039 / organism=Monocercomonoides_exilis_PA203 / gene_product=unspecified product / transcript_product=unspecified product / location=Mono_scaffold01132:3563-3799(+) / protein_length=79 / sequence_SO=supercontig / SO=protein_coding / is_pseudo=false